MAITLLLLLLLRKRENSNTKKYFTCSLEAQSSTALLGTDTMLASATEVEVELHVPDEVSTFFGVTWAQDPRKDKV